MQPHVNGPIFAPTLAAEVPERGSDPEGPIFGSGSEASEDALHVDRQGQLLARRYRIDSILAEGGMGIVYRGWHVHLDQPIAIKMMRPEFIGVSEAVERFLREAQAMARLRGKHTAQVMDVARCEDGTPFMVLEFLEGSDLRQVLERGPLPIADATALILQAADAVAEAHSNGLIHRDLKPDNLFLTKDLQGSEIVKVIDFGISKSLGRKGKFKTRSENYLGSPQYMSPEQVCSASSVDERTDIWALGVVLYELLTGRAPFQGATLPAVCAAVLKDVPIAPRELRPEIPIELESVILKCLAKAPDARFKSVTHLIDTLRLAMQRADMWPLSRLPCGTAARSSSLASPSSNRRSAGAPPNSTRGMMLQARPAAPRYPRRKVVLAALTGTAGLSLALYAGWALAPSWLTRDIEPVSVQMGAQNPSLTGSGQIARIHPLGQRTLAAVEPAQPVQELPEHAIEVTALPSENAAEQLRLRAKRPGTNHQLRASVARMIPRAMSRATERGPNDDEQQRGSQPAIVSDSSEFEQGLDTEAIEARYALTYDAKQDAARVDIVEQALPSSAEYPAGRDRAP